MPIVMTAVAIKYATNSILWDILLWSGVALIIASIATLALYIWSQSNGSAFLIPAFLVNLGICAVLSGIAYSYATKPVEQARIPKFSWVWDALTDNQIENIARQLDGKVKQKIQLACERDTCAPIAESFKKLSDKLGWELIKGDPRMARLLSSGVTGIVLNNTDEPATAIKGTIEKNTEIAVATSSPAPEAPKDCLVFIIGAKPLPEPIPTEIERQLKEFGAEVKPLSSEIFSFVSDRQREVNRIARRENFPNSTDGAQQYGLQNLQLSRETSELFSVRFGGRLSALLGRLSIFGVDMAFMVQGSSRPELTAKWLQTVGDLLDRGRIVEARKIGASNSFWFGQY
jgi:hypothetical protein